MDKREILLQLFNRMKSYFGSPNWWPGETPFEIMVGAILTQNTNWRNVEIAIKNLKEKGVLDPASILNMPMDELCYLIKPSGFYKQKAKRLKDFSRYIMENYNGSIEAMGKKDLEELRKELLSIKGIGEETADSILLYALKKPIFVVDAYTYRILKRHGLIPEEISYSELQSLFMDNLPEDVELYSDFHALFVLTGKNFCKKDPLCKECPLNGFPNGLS